MAVKALSVSQINAYIKRVLQTDPMLISVRVEGEVSNLKYHSSGHVYFSLKDEKSTISCFLPQDVERTLGFTLEEGMAVTADGRIYLYERGGRYSINISGIEPAGEGELSMAFEQLKARLEAEGLFSADKKKPIPSFPRRVAVVTSETGAAVRDIIQIIKGRNDFTDILVYPALVQGEDAPESIAAAIDDINARNAELAVDTIICGRGGGSREELWAFNTERVARSIYASKIPIISAVGHETDVSISDFVADLRAETPTAAAVLAVPDTFEYRRYTDELLDELLSRLEAAVLSKERLLESMSPDRLFSMLGGRTELAETLLERRKSELFGEMDGMLERLDAKLEAALETLDALNPAAVIKRGYAALLDTDRRMIASVDGLREGQTAILVLSDGEAECGVNKVRRKENVRA